MPTPIERFGVANWDGIVEEAHSKQTQRAEVTAKGSSVVRRFRVPGDRVYRFVADMLGYPYMSDALDGPQFLRRHLPQRNWLWSRPLSEAITYDNLIIPHQYATKCSLVPFSGNGLQNSKFIIDNNPSSTYDYFLVDVTFDNLPYNIYTLDEIAQLSDPDPDPPEAYRFVIPKVENGGRFLVPERGQWLFQTPGEADTTKWPPAGDKIGIWEGESTITLRWLDVPGPAWNQIRSLGMCGKTNNAEFLTYAPETLILASVNYEPNNSPTGLRTYDITFVFLYKSTGVNKKLHPNPSLGYINVVSRSDTSIKPIQTADFKLLFKP